MIRHDRRPAATPILDWGEQLRADKKRRRILGHRIALVGIGIATVAATIAFPPAPRLLWNASASAPIGLYAVTPGAPLEPGDMVVAGLPEPWRVVAAQRRYVPVNVPLVKAVAAVAGDEICALGRNIFINGEWAAERRMVDAKGRTMPWWSGCIRLRGRQLFLLMPRSPASFDGRYFGVTEGRLVIGRATLLWTR